jgi:hypothetical protein
VQKFINFVTRLANRRWRVVPAQKVNTLQVEIERLEKHLFYTASPPKRPKITSQDLQKYLDLAG